MVDKNAVIDWRTLNCWIEGEPTAKDGLAKRREALEQIVAPYLTTKKTNQIVEFRGRCRYFKSPVPSEGGQAIRALQFLYGIEAAWKTGDIDRAIRMAIGFASADNEVQNIQLWKSDSVGALAARARRKPGSARGGAGTRKWTPEVEQLARPIFENQRRAKVSIDAAARRTAAALKADHGISIGKDTIKNHLTAIQ